MRNFILATFPALSKSRHWKSHQRAGLIAPCPNQRRMGSREMFTYVIWGDITELMIWITQLWLLESKDSKLNNEASEE